MSFLQELRNRLRPDDATNNPKRMYEWYESRQISEVDPYNEMYIIKGNRGSGKTTLLYMHYYLLIAIFLIKACKGDSVPPLPLLGRMNGVITEEFHANWVKTLIQRMTQSIIQIRSMLVDANWPKTIVYPAVKLLVSTNSSWLKYIEDDLDGENKLRVSEAELREVAHSKVVNILDFISTRLSDFRKVTLLKELEQNLMQSEIPPLILLLDEVSDLNYPPSMEHYFKLLYEEISSLSSRLRINYALLMNHPATDIRTQIRAKHREIFLNFDVKTQVGYQRARKFLYSIFSKMADKDDIENFLDINDDRPDSLQQLVFASNGSPRTAMWIILKTMEYLSECGEPISDIRPEQIEHGIKQYGEELEAQINDGLRKYITRISTHCHNSSQYRFILNEEAHLLREMTYSEDYEPLLKYQGGIYEFHYCYCRYKNIKIYTENDEDNCYPIWNNMPLRYCDLNDIFNANY